MPSALERLHPESTLGWGAVAVGVAFLVYGLSSATGASPPSVLAGFVVVGWVAAVRWIYGLARENRRVDEATGERRPRVDDGSRVDGSRVDDDPRPDDTPSARAEAGRHGRSQGSGVDANGASGLERRSDDSEPGPELEDARRG